MDSAASWNQQIQQMDLQQINALRAALDRRQVHLCLANISANVATPIEFTLEETQEYDDNGYFSVGSVSARLLDDGIVLDDDDLNPDCWNQACDDDADEAAQRQILGRILGCSPSDPELLRKLDRLRYSVLALQDISGNFEDLGLMAIDGERVRFSVSPQAVLA